jgi:hypothetical protein
MELQAEKNRRKRSVRISHLNKETAMTKFTDILALILVCGAAAQSPSNPYEKPQDVVEQFANMTRAGALMTPDGLSKASVLFTSAKPPVVTGRITIVNVQGVDDGPIKRTARTDALDFSVFAFEMGTLDARLHYSPPSREVIHSYETAYVFHVILTDKYWRLGQNGSAPTLMTGTKQWRIDMPYWRWTSVSGAIRYVTEMRDKTDDPTIKKNAENTIAILSKMKE